MSSRTIAAISTPRGSGGIAVIRISGSEALNIVRRFFTPDSKTAYQPRTAYLGTAHLDGFIDRAIVTYFPAPHSYTGEDVVEISCHGGTFVAEGVLKKCLNEGSALATAGEFTRRAFLNGKLSLADAEGVIDLINSESAAEANAAGYLTGGVLSREAVLIQDKLTDILADINAAIDYPDDAEFLQKGKISAALNDISKRVDTITESYSYGKILKSGFSVAIAGLPNAGKSSLLNALLRLDRAIVTATAGTTRDTISETLIIKDIKINLIDTAGIRESADEIEQQGVIRSKQTVQNADLVLYIYDGTAGLTADDKKILDSIKGKQILLLSNKCDLAPTVILNKVKNHKTTVMSDSAEVKNNPPSVGVDHSCDPPTQTTPIPISAKHGTNINHLIDEIYAIATKHASGSTITITNERHYLVFKAVRQIIESTEQNLTNLTADLIAADLTDAYKKLGEITGSTASEDIINRIFQKFCLGK